MWYPWNDALNKLKSDVENHESDLHSEDSLVSHYVGSEEKVMSNDKAVCIWSGFSNTIANTRRHIIAILTSRL